MDITEYALEQMMTGRLSRFLHRIRRRKGYTEAALAGELAIQLCEIQDGRAMINMLLLDSEGNELASEKGRWILPGRTLHFGANHNVLIALRLRVS